jgi:Protein of unknown function (DUF3631)
MTTLESFPVFCPKALAGIGELPDTIADRSIRIRLERKTRGETIERFRRHELEAEAKLLRKRLARWLKPHHEELRLARPTLPEVLDDRAQDIWEPLFAIADLAGEEEEGWGSVPALLQRRSRAARPARKTP